MRRWLLITLCILAWSSPQALNYQFLKDTPAAAFTEADWEIATRVAGEALREAADGESRSWENPETGNGGSYRVEAAPAGSAPRCRKLVIHHHSQAAKATTEYLVCPEPDGTWRLPR
jgi:hypothetical protein